jgi:hypothetical protein
MSDDEKKGGYRIEYASSARAKCKGPKPCAGSAIPKGALRLGTLVDFRGKQAFSWRHWGCTTEKMITNIKAKVGDSADALDGYDDLNDDDKAKLQAAFESGKVAEEDIPETAKKAEGDEEEAPKKKRAAPKKKKAKKDDDMDEDDEDEAPPPKKKRGPPKKAEEDAEPKPKKKAAPKKKKADDESAGEEGGAEEVGKKRKRAPPKSKKKDSDVDEVEDDD